MVHQASENGRMRRAVRSVRDREPALVRKLPFADRTLTSAEEGVAGSGGDDHVQQTTRRRVVSTRLGTTDA